VDAREFLVEQHLLVDPVQAVRLEVGPGMWTSAKRRTVEESARRGRDGPCPVRRRGVRLLILKTSDQRRVYRSEY